MDDIPPAAPVPVPVSMLWNISLFTSSQKIQCVDYNPLFSKLQGFYILVSSTALYCLRSSSKLPASSASRMRCMRLL